MPFIPASNVCKVALEGHRIDSNQEWVNVFHFKFPGAVLAADRAALAAAMDTFWQSHYEPVVSAQIYIDQIVVTDLTTASAGSGVLTYTPALHGDLSNNIKPGNVTTAITHRTANRGRSYRGRTYIPGIVDEQTVNHDFWDTTSLGNILTAFSWLLNAAHTAGAVWSVLSQFTGGAPRVSGVATPITAVTADNTFDSMRRRLPGRGA